MHLLGEPANGEVDFPLDGFVGGRVGVEAGQAFIADGEGRQAPFALDDEKVIRVANGFLRDDVTIGPIAETSAVGR